MKPGRPILAVVCLLVPAMVAGCGRTQQAAAGVADLVLKWQFTPDPPGVGAVACLLDLRDKAGLPLGSGDMRLRASVVGSTVEPLLVRATEVAPGQYKAILELATAGDWMIQVDVRFPDGTRLRKEISVAGVGRRL